MATPGENLTALHAQLRRTMRACLETLARADLDASIRVHVCTDLDVATRLAAWTAMVIDRATNDAERKAAADEIAQLTADWFAEGGLAWMNGRPVDPTRVHFSDTRH